jgi:hypothetical protein
VRKASRLFQAAVDKVARYVDLVHSRVSFHRLPLSFFFGSFCFLHSADPGGHPNAPVVVTFTEPLNPTTVSDTTFALFAGGYQLGADVSGSADGRTVTLTTPLPPASVVTVVVANAVTDLAGNRLANFLSQFTTAPALDLGRPSVNRVSLTPALLHFMSRANPCCGSAYVLPSHL